MRAECLAGAAGQTRRGKGGGYLRDEGLGYRDAVGDELRNGQVSPLARGAPGKSAAGESESARGRRPGRGGVFPRQHLTRLPPRHFMNTMS